MEIGEIKEVCFNKDNIIIPSGYLECNGQEITEDMFPELHFHLSDGISEGPINLPNIPDIVLNDTYILKKIISCTYKKEIKIHNYDSEFKTNLKLNKDMLSKL
jgi:hypothetical protein